MNTSGTETAQCLNQMRHRGLDIWTAMWHVWCCDKFPDAINSILQLPLTWVTPGTEVLQTCAFPDLAVQSFPPPRLPSYWHTAPPS
jgi:hypothetical protein